MRAARRLRRLALLGAILSVGCHTTGKTDGTSKTSSSGSAASTGQPPSTTASSPPSASAATAPTTSASAPANPYEGPTGTLRGIVRMKGDEPPATDARIPAKCGEALATYGKLFRVGQDSALADALVSVTLPPGDADNERRRGGFTTAKAKSKRLTVQGCAFSQRTVALVVGQHLEVQNRDPLESYLPKLIGASSPATMVALPGGDPVRLYPTRIGRYSLQDQMGKRFLHADVFVFKYATTAVTGLNGRYAVEGIPVGKVDVNVLLPAAKMKVVKKTAEIKAGDNTLDFTMEFDAAKDAPARKKPTGPVPH